MQFLQNERQFTEEEAKKAIDSVPRSHHHHIDNGRPRNSEKKIKHAKEQLALYKPCKCGSSKLLRWCCSKEEKLVINTDPENTSG